MCPCPPAPPPPYYIPIIVPLASGTGSDSGACLGGQLGNNVPCPSPSTCSCAAGTNPADDYTPCPTDLSVHAVCAPY